MIELVCPSDCQESAFLKDIIRQVQEILKLSQEISLVAVSQGKISEINNNFRKKNQPTDVLSFEDINEIFICPDYIRRQAELSGRNYFCELTNALVHGILHLQGYDHELGQKEDLAMREKQLAIFKKIKIN